MHRSLAQCKTPFVIPTTSPAPSCLSACMTLSAAGYGGGSPGRTSDASPHRPRRPDSAPLHEEDGALRRTDEEIEKQRAANEKAAHLGRGAVGVLNAILLVGDITIVSMAIQASESTAGPFVATAGALAIAVALFTLGKLLGDSLKGVYDHRFAASLVAIGIVMFSVSLYSLRLGHVESWLGLAMSPAIGAGAVGLLGPSRLQSAVHRSEKAAVKIGKRREKAIKRRGKIAGRVEYMLTQAHLALTASGFAANSIGQMAGIADAITAYEAVANQLGITLGADWQHHPVATADQPVETVVSAEGEGLSPANDDRSQNPSNGEGTHEIDLTDAAVFVPNFGEAAEEEPS